MKRQNEERDRLAETKPLPKMPASKSDDDDTQKLRTLTVQEIEQILKRKRLPE